MIQRTLLFWWVDDEPDRLEATAKARISHPNLPGLPGTQAKIVAKPLKNEQQWVTMEKDLAIAKTRDRLPRLVIIDQILNRSDGIVRRGSTIAVAIRAQAPSVAVVGTSAASLKEIAELQRDQFIEFFCLEDLQSGERVADLFSVADGFAKLVARKREVATGVAGKANVLRLLNCPPEDADFLASCLPAEFFGSWDDETPHGLARWIWHVLLGRDGFLKDDLELATMLGLKREGLIKLLPHLSDCQYNGVFASSARRRWWVSRVQRAMRARAKAPVTKPMWELGRKILTIKNERFFSRCHGRTSTACVPDVVAFGDDTRRNRVQAMTEDTRLIETDSPPVGFEQYRVFAKQ